MDKLSIAKEKGFMDVRSDNEKILSVEEKQILERLDNFANKSQKTALKDIKFFNMTLKQIIDKFLLTWKEIIEEIILLYKKSPSFKNNIYEKVYWWKNIKSLIFDLFNIFTMKDRMIYVGLMLIIISFFLYFIVISSQ